MIEPMKLTTIVCLASEQAQSLRVLQHLAALHVVAPTEAHSSGRLETLQARRDRLNRAVQQLAMMADKKKGRAADAPRPSAADDTDARVADRACEALEARRQAEERLRTLQRAEEGLLPWGQFDETVLARLEKIGFHCALCACRPQEKVALPSGARLLEVSATKEQRCFLVVSENSLEGAGLPLASFPCGRDLAKIRQEMAQLQTKTVSLDGELKALANGSSAALERALAALDHEIAYETTLAGMGKSGTALAYLQGYVPESRLDQLRTAARRNGWAIRYQDVAETDDKVPTKLVLPKPFRIAQVVLDVVGILPGYHEIDVSISLLVFLSLFAGLLVGDAGYGLLALAACGYGLWRLHRKGSADEQAALPLRLGVVMSLCILLWGALSGTWFGLSWGGLSCLQGDKGQDNIKLLCFFIGATHLSLARLWKTSVVKSWRARLGNIGWALFLWANYFSVKALLIDGTFENFTIPSYMYAVGGVLILTCAVNWRELGDVFYAPFNFINSLSDILSYIRLYAVGLSTLYIADAFNQMGAGLWKLNIALIPVGLLIILFGHVLNVALAAMSVLVHGIRLNTQEFSGHIGIEWAGRPYRPFK